MNRSPEFAKSKIKFLFFCLMKLELTFRYPDFDKPKSSNRDREIDTQTKENLTSDFYRLKNQYSKIQKGFNQNQLS